MEGVSSTQTGAPSRVPEALLDTGASFEDFQLDRRLFLALTKMGFASPTLVQSHAIPLALDGKDVLAKAKTGSGKTVAYCVPALQKVLQAKAVALQSGNDADEYIRCILLVPTRELCVQVAEVLEELTRYCKQSVSVYAATTEVPLKEQRRWLLDVPDILVITPGKLVSHLKAGNVPTIRERLDLLVVDEADLVMSYGYGDDLKQISEALPNVYQSMLMSATLTDDVTTLKQLVLHNPAIIKLEGVEGLEDTKSGKLTEYYYPCTDDDNRFVALYTLMQVHNLGSGKMLIFVNDINRCYRVKLFLEQFSIKAAVMNSELPQNSREHIVQAFNKGFFDILIATDELVKKRKKKDTESGDTGDYGVARGLDFKEVALVLNFDCPTTVRNYVHRVGRTARGGANGTALTFVTPSDEDEIFGQIVEHQFQSTGEHVFNYDAITSKMISQYRYRTVDRLQAVTRRAVKNARMQEVKMELMFSEKLRAHFEDNPRDLEVLQHDKHLNVVKVQGHLKNLPEYLRPRTDTGEAVDQSDTIAKKKRMKRKRGFPGKGKQRSQDPLKSSRSMKKKRDGSKKSKSDE